MAFIILYTAPTPYVHADAYSDALKQYIDNINKERAANGALPLDPNSSNTSIRNQYQIVEEGFRKVYQNEGPAATQQLQDTAVEHAQNPRKKEPLSCDVWYQFFSPICWGRMLSVLIGTALITAAAWLLAVAGLLFNVLVDHTIIQFGYLFNAGVQQGIDAGWSGIRDVANIVIIGMFVFIAINIILGVKEFGEKKFIARVLIVAVLINFSLLFTKGIIDASNFVAMQFYTQSKLSPDTSAATGSGILSDNFSQSGISGQFIKFMGLSSLGDTYKALSNAAFGDAPTNYQTANGWLALLHGLVTATLLLAVALVLLYGCYILTSRAVLLIILMLTSALAFASWLIPHHYIETGWITWWKALLKSAFLAPILMALLWATLIVASSISQTSRGKGTLGDLVINPTNTLDLNALFSYVVIIGLLYASFYATQNLSSSISGFNFASALTGFAAFTPLAAASRIAGLAGRTFIGAPAGYIAGRLKESGYTESALGRAVWRPFYKTAERSFDAMNVKTVRKFAEGLGGVTFGGEIGKGGFIGVKRRQAEELDRLARAMAPSEDARRRIAGAAGARENAAVNQEREALDRQLATAQTALRNAQQQVPQARAGAERTETSNQEVTRQTTRDNIQRDRDAAQTRANSSEAEVEAVRRRFAQQIASAQPQARAQLRQAQDQQITAISQRLQGERAALQQHQQILDEWDTAVRQAADQAENTVVAPHNQAIHELTDTINHLESERRPRTDFARNERDLQLQARTLSEAMARNKVFTVGREEIVRQLGGARQRYGLRQIASQIGETGRAPRAPAPTPPADGQAGVGNP